MEIEKAREAHSLYARRDSLKSSIMAMRSRYEKNGCGTTDLTIPTAWLPEIIKIAECELDNIDKEIARL